MSELEPLARIRDFLELGGNVLLAIAFVSVVLWALILERLLFYRTRYPQQRQLVLARWSRRADRSSWSAHQVRKMLVSRVRLELRRGLAMIDAIVVVSPMLGLLGTVTGMIEVFDVMAIAGSGNARGMAAGVSKATLPTMAGMVVALSGLLLSIRLRRYADEETERLADQLVLEA